MKKLISIFFAVATLGLASCSSNDDEIADLSGSGITITDDVECCSAEEALLVYKFLLTVRNIPELSFEVDGKYKVLAYSKTGSFHTGYNEIFFVATKKSTDNYIKNFDITNITPIMNMVKMGTFHSTPTGAGIANFDDKPEAIKRGWISFVMNSGDNGSWTLSFDAKVLSSSISIKDKPITVNALPEGQEWIKSFKKGDDTYFVSLVNPNSWKTGTNTIKAYISRKNAEALTSPWAVATEQFTIEAVPTMPDMGNHTSPDNTPWIKQEDDSYSGVLNLTMTGLWRLHLTIKDKDGNIVAGGDDLSDGFSSLYLDVTI